MYIQKILTYTHTNIHNILIIYLCKLVNVGTNN